ncbi:MAG: hypothetical protein ACNS62_14660 [Candidatus Cyclobacteriaceae bacterium M3_2C_046]
MDDEYFGVDYSCFSPLVDFENTTYINDVNGRIISYDENDKFKQIVGKFKLNYFNIERARKDGFNMQELFDFEEDMLEIGKCIFDAENSRYHQDILNFYGYLPYQNLLVLNYMEIISTYRGRNIGAMVLKDIKNRFTVGCGLLALRIKPRQHVPQEKYSEEDVRWDQMMSYGKLENDEEQAFYKLAAYFQKLGFESVNSNDIFTLSPTFNTRLDKTKLQFSD